MAIGIVDFTANRVFVKQTLINVFHPFPIIFESVEYIFGRNPIFLCAKDQINFWIIGNLYQCAIFRVIEIAPWHESKRIIGNRVKRFF